MIDTRDLILEIVNGDRLDVTKTIRILLKSKQITPDQIAESCS